MALENLPSYPHTNVVGSIVTGSHGSGIHFKTLANLVTEVWFVSPIGNKEHMRRSHEGELFDRFLHSFGLLGVIYKMKMRIKEEYAVRKCIYANVPWNSFLRLADFDDLNYQNDHVSFSTAWESRSMTSLWIAQQVNPLDYPEKEEDLDWRVQCEEYMYGGTLVEQQHPNRDWTEKVKTSTSGIGLWSEKLFQYGDEPSPKMDEIVSEFFVEYHHLPEAMNDLYEDRALFREFLHYSEFQPIEQDQIPLSPAKH